MALTKQFIKSKSLYKVTFTVPSEAIGSAKKAELVGDFNDWDPANAVTLKKQKDGSHKAIVELQEGEYQFKYIFDGSQWENDWEADKYVPAGIANTENSVVIL